MAYAGLIVLLRLSGKHTLAKMNAFDLVITVVLAGKSMLGMKYLPVYCTHSETHDNQWSG